MEKNKNIFYYIAGGAFCTALIAGSYFLWKKLTQIKLNDWLEEYLKEIEEMIKNNKEKELTLEIIGHIYQVITEIDDYLYMQSNADLEEERVKSIGNKQVYMSLFAETMEYRNEFYEKASRFVYKRIGISLEAVDELLKKIDMQEFKRNLKNAKKKYKQLPNVSAEKVKEAFIYFVNKKKQNQIYEQEQIYLMNTQPDYKMRAMINIHLMKLQLKDEIKSKWDIDEKYFEQLIEKHDLLKDSEVLRCYEDLNYMN